jgi:hypothetical protein
MINIYNEIENLLSQVLPWIERPDQPGGNYSISRVRRYVEETLPFPIFTPKPTRDDMAMLLKHYDRLAIFYSDVRDVLNSVSLQAKKNEGACLCYERAMAEAQQKREQEDQEKTAVLQRELDAMLGPGRMTLRPKPGKGPFGEDR